MRILFINRMASMVRGGGETFDLEIARHLQALGCETTFLSGIPVFGAALTPITTSASFTVRTPYTGWLRWDQIRGGWRLRLADFWIFEKAAAAWAARRKGDFDVIHVCELPTFVDAWKKRGEHIPVVMRLTAPDFHDATGALRRADVVIASGATMLKVKEALRPDCVDVPNGVDAGLFRPHASPFRSRRGIAASTFVILFVARFQGVKNHRMLIRAFALFAAQHPDSLLALAGSGPLEHGMRTLCAEMGMDRKVLFLGETPFAELPDVYAAADLKVISSDYESFCFAALEAMATALPLVVTETDWIPHLIERDRGGAVVPIGDEHAMASAMLALARDAGARKRMGAWNRDRAVTSYGWEASARKLRDVYERAIAARSIV